MKAVLDSTGQNCDLYLYRGVDNAQDIKQSLMKGQLDVTILKADLVASDLQLLVAANKAALADSRNKRLTRNIHTETLYFISPSKSVTESLKTFGINEGDQDLVALAFDDETGEKIAALDSIVKGGSRADLGELSQITNWTKLATLYGLKEEVNPGVITDCVVSKAAAKDLVL